MKKEEAFDTSTPFGRLQALVSNLMAVNKEDIQKEDKKESRKQKKDAKTP